MTAHPPYLTDDLSTIELEQARLLRQNAVRSCITVEAVIVYLTIMIWAFGRQETALGWFVATSSMVLVSYLYSRYRVQGELNSENHKGYLRGHIIVCAITGAVWGGFASLQISPDNQLSLFVASNIVFAITVGGMLPGSEYRPGFIALATFCILPFTFFWFTRTEGVIQVAALGILLYYAFGLMVSAQTDRDIRDGITARQNQALMKELVERNQQIERANEERARFLAATSHDLAQPLHAQGFFINALRSRLNDDGQRELLDRIESSWRNQTDLLRGIVDVTRIDSGSIVPNITSFDIAAIVDDLKSEFETLAAQKSITFTVATDSAFIASDSILVSRILRNLISNAIRYTPPGGKVDIRTTTDAENVQVILADNGIGIPTDKHSVIFDEYVRLENARQNEQGLGLGLSIVQRLTDLLGLTLHLESAENEGTRWTLKLPRAPIDFIVPDPQSSPQSLQGSPLIVIIDDLPAARKGMATALTDWGYRTLDAGSEEEAMELLSFLRQKPDALLVDRQLAGNVIGTDVVASMRDQLEQSIPAILMTGDIAVLKDEASKADLAVLMKPVKPSDLKSALKSLLSAQTRPKA